MQERAPELTSSQPSPREPTQPPTSLWLAAIAPGAIPGPPPSPRGPSAITAAALTAPPALPQISTTRTTAPGITNPSPKSNPSPKTAPAYPVAANGVTAPSPRVTTATGIQAGVGNSPFVQAPNLKPVSAPGAGGGAAATGGLASAKRRPSDPNFKTSNVEKMLNPGSQMYLAPYRVVLGDVRQKVRRS